ncbi:uncharacterized protein EAF01_002268 [Botrytis porri]|uniref:LITAF domain-containing protein n=1 Tax=Botrytis porri TaxID=87229 RepID=A0A4Z1KF84_9HELO|nr:uncharacterized protein EAF01_002268 [Botrytis porri]KAF7910759.1 hypothetical protein EAF01_002268 [Botrytis porri]TGO84148.1 hypothetical protein BPOR_0543g00030 [Botrytis porri]
MSEYNNPPPPTYQEGVSPLTSPQVTGTTSHNPTTISPQLTGITNTSTSNIQQQPHPDLPSHSHQTQQNIHPEAYQGIEVVDPNQNTMASQQIPPQQEGFTNEKSQYQAPPPQGQYPPQDHYPAQPPPQANINQGRNNYATALPIRALQTGPTPVDCPLCGVREVTAVESHSGMTTHLIALLCCAVTCLGCIPYLISGLKDVEHKCGHCGALLAVWHRSGRTDVKVPGV